MSTGNISLQNLNCFRTIQSNAAEDLAIQCFFISAAATDVIFPSNPVNLTVTEGNHTTLTCTARGVPAPEFTWYRRSDLTNGLDTRLQVTSIQMLNDTTGFIYVISALTLMVVNRTDSGVFRCEAVNIVLAESTSDSRSYGITVNCKLLMILQ